MLILASASPRRIAILREAGVEFTALPSTAEKNPDGITSPERYAVLSAMNKALDVAARCGRDDTVLGADTVVCSDGIIGKPKDKNDAFRILRRLSGRTHSVVTGYVILRGDMSFCGSERTEVTFRMLSDDEIWDYIKTGEPMDKAGAYGIQGKAGAFVERIDGEFNNVIGLPKSAVEKFIEIGQAGIKANNL